MKLIRKKGHYMSDNKTLTRADLTESVYQEVGLARKTSAELVDAVFEEILQNLERGKNIKLSSFGNFSLRQKAERMGRNPKTGEEVPITPRKVLVFKASHLLKERVDNS